MQVCVCACEIKDMNCELLQDSCGSFTEETTSDSVQRTNRGNCHCYNLYIRIKIDKSQTDRFKDKEENKLCV